MTKDIDTVKYDYRTVNANNDPCDGWALVKLAPNCHAQTIGDGMTRDEAAMFAAAPDLLAACKIAERLLCCTDDNDLAGLRAAIAKAEGN